MGVRGRGVVRATLPDSPPPPVPFRAAVTGGALTGKLGRFGGGSEVPPQKKCAGGRGGGIGVAKFGAEQIWHQF